MRKKFAMGLHDLGSEDHLNLLEGAIDMESVHDGMNHPDTAQSQFWFVDSCREVPGVMEQYATLEGAISLDVRNGQANSSPIFFAAISGKPAYERLNGPTLFNEALMWCLHSGSAVGPDSITETWHVPVTGLVRELPRRVELLAAKEEAEQFVDATGRVNEAVLHEFDAPPTVSLTIDVAPDSARQHASGRLRVDHTDILEDDIVGWPHRRDVGAGLYILDVQAPPPFQSRERVLNLRPPEEHEIVELTP